jgi:acyl carrier protein
LPLGPGRSIVGKVIIGETYRTEVSTSDIDRINTTEDICTYISKSK